MACPEGCGAPFGIGEAEVGGCEVGEGEEEEGGGHLGSVEWGIGGMIGAGWEDDGRYTEDGESNSLCHEARVYCGGGMVWSLFILGLSSFSSRPVGSQPQTRVCMFENRERGILLAGPRRQRTGTN